MRYSRSCSRPVVVLVMLLSLIVVGGAVLPTSAPAGAASSGRPLTRPLLTRAVVSAPGAISVTGNGFTPGGTVKVVVRLRDPRGRQQDQTTTVVASRTHSVAGYYLGDGARRDAPSTTVGGMVQVSVTHLCGTTPMVRAFDGASETWSSWLGVDPTGFHVALFGPNGSTDPAVGYLPAC